MPRSFRRKPAARRGGFTLMEMLLVLAILVVLMGLVGPRILSSQKKADINTTKTQIGGFKDTLKHYALDMRTFPSTEDGLTVLMEEPSDPDAAEKWDGPYLEAAEIPKDPWGNDYQYEYPPSHGKYDFPDIWSYGPDGEEGTDDDIVNWEKEEDSIDGDKPTRSGNAGR
ncbi:MAG: type II secretion system major pseudopilin GspG [Pirellulales bacterium]